MPRRRQTVEGSLYQRTSDGRWIAVVHLGWKDGHRQRRVFTGTTPDIAHQRREAFLAARRDGFTMPKGRAPYVSEWMIHWLNVIAKRKVAPTTWEGSYRQKVTELICPYFERVPLPELDEEMIEAWHAELEDTVSRRTGRHLSPATIAQCHRIMSRALKVAVSRGKLPRNPCSNVSPPPAARPAPVLPSADAVRAVLARCRDWPGGARWALAITTGLRQGEALGLEWADVKLSAPASVTVRQSAARVKGERITKAPKSASSRRTVPLGGLAVARLRKHKQDQSVASLDGLVFLNSRGGPVHPRADWQDWQDLLADVGVARCRVHDCRHVYATMLLEEGVDPRVVQAMLGWSTTAMTEVYQHVRPVLHQQVADVVDRVFGTE
jgi:integrase